MRWDIFCRVIDNHGDIGVGWRLAADLASRGESIRLWVDDVSALAWMAPRGATGVEVIQWTDSPPDLAPTDVVVETFGCDPPERFVARMAAAAKPPAWINLEYLSAEAYVERSHGLLSPQLSGSARGLRKWFFYPGFTPRTGGLLREPGLLKARAEFKRDSWLAEHGIVRRPGERIVSLFCYDNPALPALLAHLAQNLDHPTLLLLTPGPATLQAQPLMVNASPGAVLRSVSLPWLAQPDFDRLLWSCDLNFVRGEDSFVRAQWSGVPFVWQAYPQSDQAHTAKLEAFFARMSALADPEGAQELRALWWAWNGLEPWRGIAPDRNLWQVLARRWTDQLATLPDLGSALLSFAAERR